MGTELALCDRCGKLVGRGGCPDCGQSEDDLTYREGDDLREFLKELPDEVASDRIDADFEYISRRSNQPHHGETYACQFCESSFAAEDADEFVDHVRKEHARESLSANGPVSPKRKTIRRRQKGKCTACGAKVEFQPARPCGQVRIGCSRRDCHAYYLAGTLHTTDEEEGQR